MLQAKELKVGLLLWRGAKRPANAWNCPCMVTAINRRRGFKIRSLNNFCESDWLRFKHGPGFVKSILPEMRKCTREEVERYFEETVQEIKNEIATAKRELVAIRKHLTAYKKQVSEFLTQPATS